ncbi:UNVERIFIED_CONTAM: hypothetical protein Sradi_7099300 [Sesamum radiatum]|uniref:Uncharacterized protein n=1 Tax=Sesamum radiatum TaxID=300843 RepID=A0AAW2J1N9_SESRA
MAEVKEAFFDIDVESAPGPDGYTSAFYRSAWPVIGQTLFQAIGEFFRTGKLLKQWECESSLGTDLQTKRGRRAWSSQPHHNKSGLMLKQLWRIIQNDGTSIWVDWIQHYRLRQSTIWTFNGALGWGWRKMLNLRPLLQRGVIYKVGDGSFSVFGRTYGTNEVRFAYYILEDLSHGPPTFFSSVQRNTEESVVLAGLDRC